MKAITHSIIFSLTLFLFFTYSPENPTAEGFSRPKISSEIVSLETVSIRELIENGETLLGKRIRVTGKLQNIGKNYFTDLKVALKDPDHENGDFIYVRPWLPFEFPPGPPGSRAQEKPETLSQYLGQTVELTAGIGVASCNPTFMLSLNLMCRYIKGGPLCWGTEALASHSHTVSCHLLDRCLA